MRVVTSVVFLLVCLAGITSTAEEISPRDAAGAVVLLSKEPSQVKEYLDKHLDIVTKVFSDRRTLLSIACEGVVGESGVRMMPPPANLKMLIDEGAPLEARDNEDATALHYAAEFDTTGELVRVLVKAGAKVDALDNRPSTPLMQAAANLNAEAIRALLEGGADVTIESKHLRAADLFRSSEKVHPMKNKRYTEIMTMLKTGKPTELTP